jgi:endo-1,4-beta-xylanase
MDEHELIARAEAGIQEHRTTQVSLRFVDGAGRPLPHVQARVRLARHEFKLGANAFLINSIEDEKLQRGYAERFSALLNYATLPFYWGGYERQPGQTSEQRLERMAEWCRQNGIIAKGHPLAWHEVFPQWAGALDDADVLARLQARVKAIVAHFRGSVDIWDVVNEATVSQNFANAVGRWIAREGAASCVAQALAWAREANPAATLLYNDFNVSPAFEQLAGALLQGGASVNVIGIQSHMHKELWPLEKIANVCDTYARFGLPLHFTELTVLSGQPKAQDDNDWHRVHTDWPTTAQGESAQLGYGRQFYTLLFGHPAAEAITWWDFSDYQSWQGAPSGLVRADMSPKPLYDWLVDAFHSRWRTDATVSADEGGAASLRGFFGAYEVQARLPSGDALAGQFTLLRRGTRDVTITLR